MYNGVNYFRKKAPSKIFEKVPNTSVMRQKVESQNRCRKKTKHSKFSKKRTFFTHVRVSGGKKSSFFGKFGVLCFLVTPAEIHLFTLLLTNRSDTLHCTKFKQIIQVHKNLLKVNI